MTEYIPCPDPDHAFKEEAWANGCTTCWGAGEVPTRKNKFTVASGPEEPVFRAQENFSKNY